MKIKISYIVYLCLLLTLGSCKKQDQAQQEKKIDWNKAAVSIIENVRPKLLGSWTIKEINLVPSPPSTAEIGIYKDTTIFNLGQLDLNQVNSNGSYLAANDVTGVIRFDRKVYPVGFRM